MIKKTLKRVRNKIFGAPSPGYIFDRAGIPEKNLQIIDKVQPFTMTSVPRLEALIESVRYVVRRGLPGVIAECGVWRGGSVMTIILTLQDMGINDRDIWLYDTFEGMTAPTEHDVSPYDVPALKTWQEAQAKNKRAWDYLFGDQVFNEEFVRKNLLATGYPAERLHFVKGPIEQTVPGALPDKFALLRLDTDWYESTLHEMQHMYPRLVDGGVLIIDDYGHWSGSQVAVDEYFAKEKIQHMLTRIDYSGRLVIKH